LSLSDVLTDFEVDEELFSEEFLGQDEAGSVVP
jgi:hypothetical protein